MKIEYLNIFTETPPFFDGVLFYYRSANDVQQDH